MSTPLDLDPEFWPPEWGDPNQGPNPDLSPDEQVLDYLANQPSSGFAGRAVDLVASWGGASNLLWRVQCRGEDAVLKLFLEAGQVRSRRQFDGQTLAAPYGLAPQPLWLDRQPVRVPREVVVYRYVEGDAFDLHDPWHAAGLAQAMAQLHNLPIDTLDRFSPHPINLAYFWSTLHPPLAGLPGRLATAGLPALTSLLHDLLAAARKLVEDALPLWQGALGTPVHGDLRAENCLVVAGLPLLLDWELFGLGDAALEVARWLHDCRDLSSPPAREDWLLAYRQARQDGSAADLGALEDQVEVYLRLLPLQELTTLLVGALNLAPEERRSQEIRVNATALAGIVQRSTAEACGQLLWFARRQAADLLDDPELAADCAALFVAPAEDTGRSEEKDQ